MSKKMQIKTSVKKALKKTSVQAPAKKAPSTKAKVSSKSVGKSVVLVATRKGAFFLKSDAARSKWQLEGPHFLGSIIYHVVLDPRDSKTLLLACRSGHLGPTVFRSVDMGKNWTEAAKPPAFPKAAPGQTGRVVDHVFWLTPGHPSEKDVWYAGTSPQGLFRSADGGRTWDGVTHFNNHPERTKWTGGEQDMTPDGGKLHSILVDPRDAKHMYLGMSAGGCIETTDGGKSWAALNQGCDRVFSDPASDPDSGHDPHCIQMHPLNPDRLYMQNHCGIYRIDRPSNTWQRIGKSMPKTVGDIGFPITLHPKNSDVAWVFPMDGGSVWPRVSPDGKPAAYKTKNGGKTWQRQDKGLPGEQGWFTVKRQAMAADDGTPTGLYFGTTSGEVWASRNEGDSWICIAKHLPHIYAVEMARF